MNTTIAPINVTDVTFKRTAILTVSVTEDNLSALQSILSNEDYVTVGEEIEFKSLNKGHQIIAIFEGIHAGEINFAERKEIAKAADASLASVSAILASANKAQTPWAVSYMKKDSEQGELAAAKRKVAEMEALLAKHPELADLLKARFDASQASSNDVSDDHAAA